MVGCLIMEQVQLANTYSNVVISCKECHIIIDQTARTCNRARESNLLFGFRSYEFYLLQKILQGIISQATTTPINYTGENKVELCKCLSPHLKMNSSKRLWLLLLLLLLAVICSYHIIKHSRHYTKLNWGA